MSHNGTIDNYCQPSLYRCQKTWWTAYFACMPVDLPLRELLSTHKVCKVFTVMIVILPLLPKVLLKIICCGYLLEPPRRGDSNRYPQHMILWRNFLFLTFNTNHRFPPFLQYLRCKSGVTFVRRCFRDAQSTAQVGKMDENGFIPMVNIELE